MIYWSNSSLSALSVLIASDNLGKSLSKHWLNCSIESFLNLPSLEISFLINWTLSSTALISLDSLSFLYYTSASICVVSFWSRAMISFCFKSKVISLVYFSSSTSFWILITCSFKVWTFLSSWSWNSVKFSSICLALSSEWSSLVDLSDSTWI